ncbi:hypothetical protein L277_11635 [Mannheimia haemolytica D193]|nr:hypothetical protein F382_09305 [Mannheimia haemolytica D153]EPZ24610.1 hypothetical protein L277_11635 [Mannheimia haemolytica D193]
MAKFLAFGADIMAKATVPIAMLSGFRKKSAAVAINQSVSI